MAALIRLTAAGSGTTSHRPGWRQPRTIHDLGDARRGELGQLGLGLDRRVSSRSGSPVPVAFVRPHPDEAGRVTADEIVVWCKSKMAVYKMLEVRIVDALAMTATGKVIKEELAKLL